MLLDASIYLCPSVQFFFLRITHNNWVVVCMRLCVVARITTALLLTLFETVAIFPPSCAPRTFNRACTVYVYVFYVYEA